MGDFESLDLGSNPSRTYASLAQSGLERVAFNLVVVGSTPTGGID